MYRIVVQSMFQTEDVYHTDKWDNALSEGNYHVTPLIARVAVYSVNTSDDAYGILLAHKVRNLSSGRMGKWTKLKEV